MLSGNGKSKSGKLFSVYLFILHRLVSLIPALGRVFARNALKEPWLAREKIQFLRLSMETVVRPRARRHARTGKQQAYCLQRGRFFGNKDRPSFYARSRYAGHAAPLFRDYAPYYERLPSTSGGAVASRERGAGTSELPHLVLTCTQT